MHVALTQSLEITNYSVAILDAHGAARLRDKFYPIDYRLTSRTCNAICLMGDVGSGSELRGGKGRYGSGGMDNCCWKLNE